MNIPLDEVLFFDCVTASPTTGAAVDADSTPTFEIFEESTDTDIGVGGNLTKRTSKTGNYRGTFTISAANGFEVGKWYSVIGTATVGGITGKAVLKHFRVVAAEAAAGVPKVDIDTIKTNPVVNAGTITFPTTATLASTTNITAGTIAIVTTLTNLPAITAGWLTATGIAADAITAAKVADGAIDSATFASGCTIPRVTLADTLTTYTGNTPQTGDSFARIGANGGGLTSLAPSSTALSTATWAGSLATALTTLAGHDPGAALGTSTLTQAQVTGGAYSVQSASCVLGDSRLANLDAAVTTRMASYTQPAGFLAATFPAVVASTTNITAGIITTVTTLINLPAAPTDWLSDAAVSAAAVTKIQAGLSTYGGTDTSGTTTLLARLTSTRAGLLDNLDAAVSTRSTYAGADTSGTTTLLSRITGPVFLAADYIAPLSAAGTRTAVGLATASLDAQLATLDGDVLTRLAAASYVAPPSAASISTQVASDLSSAHGGGSWATATGFSTHTAGDVWAVGTRLLTAGTNIVLAKGVGVTGFNDLSAAQVNAEADSALADVGLTATITGRIDAAISTRSTYAGADTSGTTTLLSRVTAAVALAADLATVAGYLDTEIAAIKAKTDQLTFTVALHVDATAAVDVDEAAIAAAIAADIAADIIAALTGVAVTVTSPLSADGSTLEIRRGDSYSQTDGRAFTWTVGSAAWPTTLAGGSCAFVTDRGASYAMTVPVATGSSRSVRLELTAVQTLAMATGPADCTIRFAEADGDTWTIQRVALTVK